MPKIICNVPESSTTAAQIVDTEVAFKAIYAEHFGSAKGLTILWMLLPNGQAFQAGQPASVYIALIEVEDGLDQSQREPAMWAFSRRWAEIMGVNIERLMVTCMDSANVAEYLKGNRNRIRPMRRLWFVLTTIAYLLQSRRRNGYAELRANL